MSLINQVLKDLDQRRADAGGNRLPSGVRSLPQEREKRPLFWQVAVLVAVASGAAVFAWQSFGPGRPLPQFSTLPVPLVVNTALPPLTVQSPDATPAAGAAPAPEPAQALTVSPLARAAEASPAPPDESKPESESTPGRALPVEPVSRPRRPSRDGPPALKLSSQLSAVEIERQRTEQKGLPLADPVEGVIEKSAVDLSPKDRAERFYRSALSLINQGRRDDGLTSLRAALRDDATHVPARQLLIKFYLDSRAFDSAQGVLRDGLAVLPKQLPWAMLLARLLADRDDNVAALQVLEAHESAATGNAEYQGAAGAILQRLARDADAEQRYARAARIAPANGRWQLGLALAREAQGKAAEAREAYQQALAARTLSPELQAFVEAKLK